MYKIADQIKPFWAQSSGYTEGRDPLGIQNSSIATYGKLLPGLTNLTQRIRYYGFYCWVLWQFQKKVIDRDESFTPSDQLFFIRKAELLLAFIMEINYPDVPAVSGKNYVHDFVKENPDSPAIDLNYGAGYDNQKGRSPYWSVRSGAFGQYYVGSLIRMKLIYPRNESELFGITKLGEQLAESFHINTNEQSLTFLGVVEEGYCEKEYAESLRDFSLHLIPENTGEWEFYLNMLFNDDSDTTITGTKLYLRQQTLKTYLEYIDYTDERDATLLYRESLYVSKGNKNENPTLAERTWYYFQLNEYFHYAYESILWCILSYLSRERSMLISSFTEFVTTNTLQNYKHEFTNIENLNNVINQISENALGLVKNLEDIFKQGNFEDGIWVAIKLILRLFKENSAELEELSHLQTELSVIKAGNVVSEMDSMIIEYLEKPFDYWVEKLIFKLIDQHLSIAYQKMGSGQKNVLKMDIEDGHFIWINHIHPSFTTPRLYSVTTFLKDLKLIDIDNRLTEIAKNYLPELS